LAVRQGWVTVSLVGIFHLSMCDRSSLAGQFIIWGHQANSTPVETYNIYSTTYDSVGFRRSLLLSGVAGADMVPNMNGVWKSRVITMALCTQIWA
jgi:hypothetical protein